MYAMRIASSPSRASAVLLASPPPLNSIAARVLPAYGFTLARNMFISETQRVSAHVL